MKKLLFGISIASVVTLIACGGGGGGSSGATGFQQTYTVSAAQGELISYSVNTQNLTYSYNVTRSQYGCELTSNSCHSENGTLTQNSDKSYSVSGNTSSKFFALKNGILIGTLKLGSMPATPIIGIPDPISTSNVLAGTYNYISAQCAQKTQGLMTGCHGLYGSLTVTDSGSNSVTYSTCEGDDIENPSRTCTNTTNGTGTYDPTLRAWKFYRNGSTNENYMVAFTSADGKKIAYLDFNDAGGYGYGQATMSEKYALQRSYLVAGAGDWFFVNLTPGQDSTTWIETVTQDGVVRSNGGTLTLNTPWDGFAKNSLDARGVMIAAGKDVITFGGYTNLSGDAKYTFATKISQ